MARKKIELPDCLTEFTRFYLHPEILRDLRIAQLRSNTQTLSELLHELLCDALERDDLALDPSVIAKSH